MNKKVLILSPQPFFETRGTPINVREMLHALSEAGFEITLLAYPFGQELQIKNVKIIRSPKVFGIKKIKIGPSFQKIILDIFFFFKAIKLVLTNNYDIFHGIEEAAYMACFLSLIKRKKFIADVDSCIPEQLKNSGFITNKFLLNTLVFIERICFKRASKVLTVCQALTNEIKKIQPKANIVQIEDFPVAEQDNTKSINLRTTYNIPNTCKIILYAGNFESYQGVDLLIKAFANTENSHLVLVGGNESRIHNYKELAKNLKIDNRITFTGILDSCFMQSIHSQADILASPRLNGTNTPLKIYSYMDAEKLIIATKIISHTQVLSEKEAILTEPNVTAFTEGLKKALVENTKEKILSAKKLVDTKFSRNRFRSDIQKMYQEVLCQ